MITKELNHDDNYILYFGTKPIGRIVQECDGYYYYEDKDSGLYNSYGLRLIADYIDNLNKSLDDKINQYFNNE